MTIDEIEGHQARLTVLAKELSVAVEEPVNIIFIISAKMEQDKVVTTAHNVHVSTIRGVPSSRNWRKALINRRPEAVAAVSRKLNLFLNQILGKRRGTPRFVPKDYLMSVEEYERELKRSQDAFARFMKEKEHKKSSTGLEWELYEKRAEETGNIDYGCNFKDGRCKQQGGWHGESPMCCCSSCASSLGYLSSIPIGSSEDFIKLYNPILGFWREGVGCTIPRKHRSTTCLGYNCKGNGLSSKLHSYLSDEKETMNMSKF